MCVSHQHYQACWTLPHPVCVCVCHERWHKRVLMEARWNDPSHGAHPWGSASSRHDHPSPHRDRDANDWFVLIKIITKCWYSLIVQNTLLLLLFFIEILHLHKFTCGFCFWNHKVQTCDIKLKCDYREKINKKYRQNINISYRCVYSCCDHHREREREKKHL